MCSIFIEDGRSAIFSARRLLMFEVSHSKNEASNSFLRGKWSVLVRWRNGSSAKRILACPGRQRPLLPSRHSPDTRRFLRFCFQRNRGSRVWGHVDDESAREICTDVVSCRTPFRAKRFSSSPSLFFQTALLHANRSFTFDETNALLPLQCKSY